MAHFAEIDENNVVLRVIVVADEDCQDANGDESEEVGAAFCQDLLGGTWLQTSYNSNLRGRFAGPGFVYDAETDEFVNPNAPKLSEKKARRKA